MSKSGLADSPFFARPTNAVIAPPSASIVIEEQPQQKPLKKRNSSRISKSKSAEKPQQSDIVIPSNHATVVSRHHDTTVAVASDTHLETVRRAVREFGKEAATHRFTLQEKKALADLIYAFRQRDIRTSENEITRIAVNYVVSDFRRNGAKSILSLVLHLLNE